MGTLRYGLMSCSLDGYVADAAGDFDWGAPDETVHAFINDQVRDVRTFVVGRHMFDAMRVWDTWTPGESAAADEFAELWKDIDKVVCSDSLAAVDAPRTRLEPRLTTDRLGEIVAETDGVVEVSGPTTAAGALRAGIVDEITLRVVPAVVGAGLRVLPDDMRADLRLAESQTLRDGSVFLRYTPAR
ncbi:dihydrofolate reductase family protein [Isoptericola sp. 4D.3]|uniref:Dihydrofolate reductase family protein n=1 Tax=Isoptericola peretonis TaxID=2918523 RepID=A0ABT0J1Y3_9MICO|nr:dihydrofolate reductase family protein [Isoptericola sp. 4D.3]